MENRIMPLRVPCGALVFLLFCVASPVVGEVEEINVEISSNTVTLSCPGNVSKWEVKDHQANKATLILSNTEALTEIEKGKEFICKQGEREEGKSKRSRIYLKIKVCEDCVELSFGLGAGIIMADLLLTLGVLLLVYFGCRKQQGFFGAGRAGRGTPGQQQGPQADHPPPVPNPDYEPIRKGQREVYAGLEPRAF